jgi:DNA helicase-2/ATP-dependent DNA helicase PcrA
MNFVRHELGFSKMESRFPTKGTCLAIYSRAVNAELPLGDVLRGSYPWCAGWSQQLRELFSAYVEAKQAQNVLATTGLIGSRTSMRWPTLGACGWYATP